MIYQEMISWASPELVQGSQIMPTTPWASQIYKGLVLICSGVHLPLTICSQKELSQFLVGLLHNKNVKMAVIKNVGL